MDITLETNEANIPRRFHHRLTRRFLAGFSRLSGSVRRIHVSLKIKKGEPEGQNRICQIQLFLADGGQIMIRQSGRRFARAIGQCIRKAKHQLVKHANKRRRYRAIPAPA